MRSCANGDKIVATKLGVRLSVMRAYPSLTMMTIFSPVLRLTFDELDEWKRSSKGDRERIVKKRKDAIIEASKDNADWLRRDKYYEIFSFVQEQNQLTETVQQIGSMYCECVDWFFLELERLET